MISQSKCSYPSLLSSCVNRISWPDWSPTITRVLFAAIAVMNESGVSPPLSPCKVYQLLSSADINQIKWWSDIALRSVFMIPSSVKMRYNAAGPSIWRNVQIRFWLIKLDRCVWTKMPLRNSSTRNRSDQKCSRLLWRTVCPNKIHLRRSSHCNILSQGNSIKRCPIIHVNRQWASNRSAESMTTMIRTCRRISKQPWKRESDRN